MPCTSLSTLVELAEPPKGHNTGSRGMLGAGAARWQALAHRCSARVRHKLTECITLLNKCFVMRKDKDQRVT